MSVSPLATPHATPTPVSRNSCVECGSEHTERSIYLPGFGEFHPECVQTCACSWAWPVSLIRSGEVIFYCGTCALAAGRDALL
jgi:hypothetical protein